MSMIAIIAVAATLTVVAQVGLLGKLEGSSAVTPCKVLVTLLPSVAVAGALGFSAGFTLTWAVVAAIAIVLGVLLAVVLGPPSASAAGVATRGLGSAISYAVILVVGSMFVSWIASVATAFSTLNHLVVVVLVVLAGAAVAFGRGSSRGLAKTATIIFAVVAVLMLVIGFVGGSASFLNDPVIFYDQVGLGSVILYGLAVVLVTGLNPAIRDAGGESRGTTLRGGIATALFTLVGYLGLLLLFGGAIKIPSVPMQTVVAYVPPTVAGVFLVLVSIIAAVGAGTVIASAVRQSLNVTESAYHIQRRELARAGHIAVAGLFLFGLAAISPKPQYLVPLAALLAVVGWVIDTVAARKHGRLDQTTASVTPVASN